ncbi:hypothetical protein D3C81_1868300 [compost metagenome]
MLHALASPDGLAGRLLPPIKYEAVETNQACGQPADEIKELSAITDLCRAPEGSLLNNHHALKHHHRL